MTKGGPSPATRVLVAAVGLLVAVVLAFGVLAPPEHCPDATADELTARATAAVDWFTRNQLDDGTWLYEYDADADRDLGSYNIVRHAGAIMGLYQAATAGIPGALESADRGRAWLLQHLLERDGWTAVSFDGRTAVGATALFVAGLVERRLATGETGDDNLIRWLARFLVAQTEPSGAVLSDYDNAAGQPVPDRYSKYYTGEAYWALARVHRQFPDEGWGESADRIGNYLATSRDEVEGYWPPLPDHWAAYGLAETVEFPERDPDRPLTDAELDHAREQAGLFGSQVRWVSQQAGPWGSSVRGSFTPRGGGYGVVGEALTGLWLTAEADERLDGIRSPVADRAECIAALAMDAQRVDEEAASAPAPDRVDGAWFVDGVTRMDDQQHAISALLRTVAVVEGADADTNDDAPSWGLWLLALVAAVNPVFVAFGVPRDAARRERVTIAASGGVLGAVVLVVAGLVAGPLLDALGVSAPAARIGVGIVGGVAGLSRMIRRPPSSEPAMAGRKAAIVPVAVPLFAAPAAVLLAIGAGADLGLVVIAAAALVAIAMLAAVTAVLTKEGPSHSVWVWVGRLLSAAGVVACILLVIDGVYDV
jgi:small neutral amino acid transporter SnatA (MarC family)